MNWIDINKEIGIQKQRKVFFINSSSKELLVNRLTMLGFRVYVLNGKKIDSELSFFDDIYSVLGFPDYCGKNWDAFYDCLGDFNVDGESAIALVWDDAPTIINKSLYSFVRCLVELVALPERYRKDPEPEGIRQFEVFFIGEGDEFLNL